MAEDKKSETPPAAKAEKADLVAEIGTLTYPRAVQNFGKDRAIEVMQKVASIGGHGLFDENELKSPLFGGLAMPSLEALLPPTMDEFKKLPEAEFYFQAALEEFETLKKNTVDARAEINRYYASLK